MSALPADYSKPPGCIPLSEAPCGQRVRVVDLGRGSSAAVRLRELGFCESAVVCKVADCGPCICTLMGTRVALGRDLASQVYVRKCR